MLTLAVAQLVLVAQLSGATVSGTVRDAASGAPLTGAVIAISGAVRDISTGTDGHFKVPAVPQGLQQLTVRCYGHASRTLEVLVPHRGEIAIDISLDDVPVRLAPVSVFDRRTSTRTRPSERASDGDQVVTAAQLAHHPLLAEPDVLRAVAGGDVFMRPESTGGLFVRGGRSDQVSYSLDGIPVLGAAHLGSLLGSWNTDALAGARLSVHPANAAAASVLSGSLDATTLVPTDSFTLRAALSSTHARLTAAGPLSASHVGYLLSVRQAVPTLHADADPNLLRGESSDWLGKLSLPIASGTLAFLIHASGDGFTSSRVVAPVITGAPRNTFEWGSRSIGASWRRARGNTEVRATAWQATAHSSADWNIDASDASLDSRRTDYGMQIVRRPATDRGGTALSARVESIHTAYDAHATDTVAPTSLSLHATEPIATFDVTRTISLRRTVLADIGVGVSTSRAGSLLTPHARIDWSASTRLSLSAHASRALQHVQSLRNTESVVSHTFPAELYAVAARGMLPIARGDQASITAEFRPASGLSLAVLAYARTMRGVLMAAEDESGPFAVASRDVPSFATGRARATGASADLRFTSARVTALVMFSAQRVRYRTGGADFRPEFSAPQRLDAGVTIAPSRDLEFRVGGMTAFGRRATVVRGDVAWDGCNLADRACEFAGTPASTPSALGALALPHYLRFDVGARKQWHARAYDRDNPIALYGTVTNVFNRTNYLTRAEKNDVLTGVEMRSRSLLVVGIEWRY